MRAILTPAVAFVFLRGVAAAQNDPHALHAAQEAKQAAPAPAPAALDEKLPAPGEQAKAILDKSPRHGEWVKVKLADGKSMGAWVVYPERKDRAPVVLVIHEIFGLTDWIRAVADQLAKEGFIAVAPDLIAGKGAEGAAEPIQGNDAMKPIRDLTPEEMKARLDAARDYATKLPAANGKSASIGFCWGGGASFTYATHQPGLNAAVVYYGTSPAAEALANVKAPVLGLYGGNDARVNATIEPAQAEMKKLAKKYEPNIYEGAGHGFLRQQTGQDGANLKATQQAWLRTVAFLRENTK